MAGVVAMAGAAAMTPEVKSIHLDYNLDPRKTRPLDAVKQLRLLARFRDAIRYHDVKFDDAVLEATDGRGVDVVYDGVGRSTFTGSLRSLRPRGTLALFGGASGAVESVTPLDLAEAGSVFFTRPHMADYMASTEEIAWRAGDMFRFAVQGDIKVRIDTQFPLGEASEAHRVMEQGGTRGKLLLYMNDSA